MLKYEKTVEDIAKEAHDLKYSPIMVFLRHQEYFKFNVGDIIVKQTKYGMGNTEWKTTCTPGNGAPIKFMYVFENSVGIGYVKQLRVDGSGFTSQLTSMTTFNPDYIRFVLDPEYADHLLLGDESFEYNKEHVEKKAYRKEAMKKNEALLIDTKSVKKRVEWFESLKAGDVFYSGHSHDTLTRYTYTVVSVLNKTLKQTPNWLDVTDEEKKHMKAWKEINISLYDKVYDFTSHNTYNITFFRDMKLMTQQPFPLQDPLCGQAK